MVSLSRRKEDADDYEKQDSRPPSTSQRKERQSDQPDSHMESSPWTTNSIYPDPSSHYRILHTRLIFNSSWN
jgi:hypothetical protein